MKNFISEIRADKVTYYEFMASFIVLVLTFLLIVVSFRNIPPLVPLFNQLPWGNNRLIQTQGIFIPIILLFAIFIFNVIFSSFLYKKNNPLLSRVIASVTLLIAIMNLLFITRTIFVIR